jgi:hypothetical protein
MGALRGTIQTHPDAGLHGLRHTFLTEAGGCTDPFTLQYVAGHDSIRRPCAMSARRQMRSESCFSSLRACLGSKFSLRNGRKCRVGAKIQCSCNYPSRAARASC